MLACNEAWPKCSALNMTTEVFLVYELTVCASYTKNSSSPLTHSFILSFFYLPYDRPIASSKAVSLQSAI